MSFPIYLVYFLLSIVCSSLCISSYASQLHLFNDSIIIGLPGALLFLNNSVHSSFSWRLVYFFYIISLYIFFCVILPLSFLLVLFNIKYFLKNIPLIYLDLSQFLLSNVFVSSLLIYFFCTILLSFFKPWGKLHVCFLTSTPVICFSKYILVRLVHVFVTSLLHCL